MYDISNELTVFLITTEGEPNFNECYHALKNQKDINFNLEIIKDYYPMSKAFQEMHNRCKTKYYVEVDSDMVLYDYAVKTMYDAIKNNDEKHPFICYRLKDVHLDFPLYGVKVYRYANFVKYPYNLEHPSCEVEQMDRMKVDGYDLEDLRKEIIGLHSPNWTAPMIFERYYNLMEKFKIFKYVWMEKLPEKLRKIYEKNPTDINFNALAGALASIYSDKTMEEEKDVRNIRKEYKRLDTFMKNPTQCTLYMTSKCNFKCDFCLRQYDTIKNCPDMSEELVNTLTQKFPELSGFCICGFGEPLSSFNLVPILKLLKQKKKYTSIITNGSLLEAKLPELIGEHQPDYISVSLNAHTPEGHKKCTKTDTFDSVIRGIKALVASPIDAYVSAVVSTENIKEIPALISFVKSLGIKTLHLHNILPHFDDSEFKNFWDLAMTDEHTSIIEEWKKLPGADIVAKYPTLVNKGGEKQVCNFPWRAISIDGSGALSVCNSVFPCNEDKFGNINDFVVWGSNKLNKFREDFLNKKIPACKKCFRNFQWM